MITDEMADLVYAELRGSFGFVAEKKLRQRVRRALEAAEAVRPKMVHVADWVYGPSRSVMLHANTDAEECVAQCCAESGDDQDDYTVTPLYAETVGTKLYAEQPKPSDPNNPVDSFGVTVA